MLSTFSALSVLEGIYSRPGHQRSRIENKKKLEIVEGFVLQKILSQSYRIFVGAIAQGVAKLIFSKERLEFTLSSSLSHHGLSQGVRSRKRRKLWFHAASVGELESLWTLVMMAADQGNALIVTVLSESARLSIQNLNRILQEKKAEVIFVGYSPLEGSWRSVLSQIQPDLFITAKYEAWPELWMSLAELRIPLVMVSVQMRRSLRLAQRICHGFYGMLPRMYLFVSQEKDRYPIQKFFQKAVVQWLGEPRWDRVNQRRTQGSRQAKELIQLLESRLDRPWGVIGSAWLGDLKAFGVGSPLTQGSLWIVPHRVDADSIQELTHYLEKEWHFPFILRTSDRAGLMQRLEQGLDLKNSGCLILVDEMGFLSELYSFCDWAFVGGGFGAGVHSTIEPAICGIPVACGPQGVDKFSEIDELQKTHQLEVLAGSEEVRHWLLRMKTGVERLELKRQWMKEAEGRLGATQKIWDALEKINSSC